MFDQKSLGTETTGDTARRGRLSRNSSGLLPSHGEYLGRANNNCNEQQKELSESGKTSFGGVQVFFELESPRLHLYQEPNSNESVTATMS